MNRRAALSLPVLVCTLSAAAWAGDGKACLEGVVKACVEIGTAVANDEPAVGDMADLRAKCEKNDETACAGLLREQIKEGCRHGKEAACRVLGEGEARASAEEAEPTTETLEAGCKTKSQPACVDLAVRILKQNPSKPDEKRALALLDRSCKAGVGDGCAHLGMVLVFSSKAGDSKRGLKMMKRACDLGSKAGCAFQRNFQPPPQPKLMKPGEMPRGSGILQTDDVGQVMKNLAKVGKLLKQNCDLGYADACAELRENDDADPSQEKSLSPAELTEKIRKLEKQAAAGPARRK